MKTSKTFVVFNPAANRHRAQMIEKSLRNYIGATKAIVWRNTTKPEDGKYLAIEAIEHGFERIISAGGDGTTAEIVNGMMSYPKHKRPMLGLVPIGTGNDFAGSLGIPHDPKEALQKAIHGNGRPVDIGKFMTDSGIEHYWVNVVGIGFDAKVDIHTRSTPFFTGFWLYFASALRTILQNHTPYHFHGTIDGQTLDKKLLLLIVSNGRHEGGGFKIAPTAKLDDGWLNYVRVRQISRLQMLLTLPYFLRGTQDKLDYVESGHLKKLQITTDLPMQIHADGEIIAGFDSKITSLKIEVIPTAINIIH